MERDYVNYIDFPAFKLAELAFKLDDFNCAEVHYRRVLDRLNSYQGDAMAAVYLAQSIRNNIDKCNENKKSINSQIFKESTWLLTKSSFVKGRQCQKYLFLDKFKKKLSDPISNETKALFEKGVKFEEFVRKKYFTNGINIKDEVGVFSYFDAYTSYILANMSDVILYEATIIEYHTLVMCDVLIRKNNEIHIYEIKASKKLKNVFIDDIAIQYAICKKRFGNQLKTFNLIIESDNYEIQEFDLTTELDLRLEKVLKELQIFTKIIENEDKEPEVSTGKQCSQPYDCFFKGYCGSTSNLQFQLYGLRDDNA